jgi:MFS family permease
MTSYRQARLAEEEENFEERLSVDYDDIMNSGVAGDENGWQLDPKVSAMSWRRRFWMVLYGGLITMLTSGVVLVMPPVIDVLVDDGLFHDRCPKQHAHQCDEQRDAFQQSIVFAVNAFNLASFPAGLVLDKFGPRLALMLGSCVFAAGTLLLANAPGTDQSGLFIDDNTVMIGFTLLGSSGALLFQPFLHLANVFPDHSGTITTMLVSMLEGSCVVFAVMNALHFSPLDLDHRTLFLGYTAVPVIVLLTSFLWPTVAFKKATKNVDHHYTAMHSEEEEEIDPFVAEKSKTFVQQLVSVPYFCFCVFMITGLYRTNFYTNFVIASQVGGSGEKGDADNEFYRTAFAWIMPLGGIISVPFVGKCLDKLSVKTNLLLLALLGLFMDLAVLQGNPPFEGKALFLVAYTLTSIFRAALVSVNCTYLTHVFGWKNYGSLLGFATFTTGVVGFSMSTVNDVVADGPDYSMFAINCVCVGISLLRLLIPVWFHYFDKRKRVELSVYGAANMSVNKSLF